MAWDRNSANYPRPVAQFDPTACWAASLEWWLRCMSVTRTIRNQLTLINEFVAHWDSSNPETNPNYGTITAQGLVDILDSSSIRMNYVVRGAGTWNRAHVEEKLALSPVLIAYNETEVNGFHLNVIHSLNPTTTADVNVMDPNRGRYRTRSHTRFNTRDYILAWAK